MAFAISATYGIAGGFFVPAYQINISGMSGFGTAATYLVNRRQLSSGAVSPVRGMNLAPVTGDAGSAADYEFEYYSDTSGWVYDAYIYDSSNTQLATVTSSPTLFGATAATAMQTAYPGTTAVWQSIQQPALSLPLVIGDFSAWGIAGRILSVNNVLGRPNPVVLSDTMGGRTGSFTVLVSTDISGAAITDSLFQLLYTYNDTFLFQPFYSSGNVKNMYFKISNIDATRLSTAESAPSASRANALFMSYSVNFIEVDRPIASGSPPELISWQDVLNNNALWSNVKTDHANWLDVLNNPTA